MSGYVMASIDTGRKARYPEDECNCCGNPCSCGVCGAWIISSSIILVLVVTGSVLAFAYTLQICSSDSQCPASPGTVARCSGICFQDRIVDHCETDSDCALSECHYGICSVKGQCEYVAKKDGTFCDDKRKCTPTSTCQSGVCIGEPLQQQCKKCVEGGDGAALVADMSTNGEQCDDNNLCTVNDKCYNGFCSGTEKMCQNATCKLASCDPDLGCLLENYDRQWVKDPCTNSKCENGVYSESFQPCFDGNPCTLDACYPLSGVCVHPPSEESCLTVCHTDSDCFPIASSTQYKCWDGMCVDSTSSEMIIRISKAEVETQSCEGNSTGRLQLRFFMDSDIKNGIMHIPQPGSITSIFPHMNVFDVESVYIHSGSAVRTHFSLRSPCRDLSIDCYPFIKGDYEIEVKRYGCTTFDAAHCQNNIQTTTNVMASLNILDCPFAETQLVSYVPELTIHQDSVYVNASLEVEEFESWITDATLCIPSETPMKDCILNRRTLDCPFRGCNAPDYYLAYKVTFLKESNYTGAVTAVSNGFNIEFARGYENYAGDRCESVDSVDWMRFKTGTLIINNPQFQNKEAILDIKYSMPSCGRRLSLPGQRIGHFVL